MEIKEIAELYNQNQKLKSFVRFFYNYYNTCVIWNVFNILSKAFLNSIGQYLSPPVFFIYSFAVTSLSNGYTISIRSLSV